MVTGTYRPELARESTGLSGRIEGYDAARALAIFGMIVVNFKIVMGSGASGPRWLVPLAGRLPSYESLGPCKFHYERLAMPLDYTGGLLLGSGLMRFVYMGHQPAWQYQQVYELVFEGGRLIAADDRSGAMSVVRARLQQADGPPAADPSKDPISAWIERCFDRSYRR